MATGGHFGLSKITFDSIWLLAAILEVRFASKQ